MIYERRFAGGRDVEFMGSVCEEHILNFSNVADIAQHVGFVLRIRLWSSGGHQCFVFSKPFVDIMYNRRRLQTLRKNMLRGSRFPLTAGNHIRDGHKP
jgi:hypothetical protein